MTAFLFLDFDGVLHPKGCCAEEQFIHRPRLESVLRDFPLVRVVISSSWQEAYSIAALRVRFSDDIRQRIIGVTASDEKSRYYQIQDYLQRTWPHGVRWVALDDAAEEFPARCPELVLATQRRVSTWTPSANCAAGLTLAQPAAIQLETDSAASSPSFVPT